MSSKTAGRTAPRAARASSLIRAAATRAAKADAGPAFNPVHHRILAATVEVIAARGLERLSMTEISQAAGISRQTLYRYFASKEVLIEGVIRDFKQRIGDSLYAAIEADPSLDGRLRAVSGYNSDERDRRRMEALLRSEPAFMLRFLQGYAEEASVLVGHALRPFLDAAEREHGVVIDRNLVAETLTRLRLSLFLVPGSDDLEYSRRVVRALVLGVIEDPAGWTAPAASIERRRAHRIGR